MGGDPSFCFIKNLKRDTAETKGIRAYSHAPYAPLQYDLHAFSLPDGGSDPDGDAPTHSRMGRLAL